MKNIDGTSFLHTSSERYWSCGHFDYNNCSIRSFWSEILTIEGPNCTLFSIFATVKIGFYHNFISLLWINYIFDHSDFFVVLDIGLVILNLFLFCKYLINFWNSEKQKIMFFYAKKTKKVTIHSNFAEFSRTPLWSESHDYGLKMSLKGLDFWKKLLWIKKSEGLWGPSLG